MANSTQKNTVIAASIAAALAAPCEGLRQYAYRDVTGLPTICMGSTKGVKMGDFRTIPECKAMLSQEMLATVEHVDRCHPGLPIPILAAASDGAYNFGIGIICDKQYTLARSLYAKQYLKACNDFLLYDKAKVVGVYVALPGLTKRRGMEKDLCLTGLTLS